MIRRRQLPGKTTRMRRKFTSACTRNPDSFFVASYNVHRFVGTDRRFAPERVARVVNELQAQIVGLQEIDAQFYRAGTQLECLAEKTGMELVLGPTRHNHAGHYGNALLTSYPVKNIRRIDLSVYGREPRGALDVDLWLKGQTVRIIVAHLGLGMGERRRQIKHLLDIFHSERDRMEIMLGDFNEWIPVGKPLSWIHRFFGRSPSLRTFPSFLPILPLDRIWVRPLDAIAGMGTHRTPLSRVASDHLPVKACITPNGAYEHPARACM